MFGLLKKKFKGLTDKILGKSQEKIKEEKDTVVDESLPISQDDASSLESDNLEKDTVSVLEKDVKTDDVKVDFSSIKDVKDDIVEEREFIKDVKEDVPLKKEVVKEKSDEILKKDVNFGHSDETLSSSNIKKDSFPESKEVSKAYKDIESKKVDDIKKGTFTKIKSIFSSKVRLSEKEIFNFLDDFEISLLEADVSIDSASSIIEDLKKRLLNFSFSKSNLLDDIKKNIKETLKEQLNIDCDLENYITKEPQDPLVILIIGPNGAGKTTTISKFAKLYKEQGKSVVLASSDTFRAGSIDQLEVHAKRLDVRVVKQNYGSDPAAVAFDAVVSAKANKNDVVLIDTAGRQDTNINLMQELSKIKRVVKPHLTIYIGESQSGQTIVEQIDKFDKEIGVTGVILTKMDTDPKGGVAISILNELKKPIFYIGTGQDYEDIEKFSPEYIIERIV